MRILVPVLVLSLATAAHAQTATSQPTPQASPITILKLHPETKTISAGDSENYTATGFVGPNDTVGRNMTQKVNYSSSDPTVAEAPNAPPNKGKVNGLKPGVVTISATDPDSGVSSTDPGGVSGTLTVQGALVSITLKPADKNAAVGDSITYTATGVLSDGNTKNLTQKVTYASSDTSVAVCPNASGNKSQVQAVGVGTATITATDPVTNISSTGTGGVSGALTVREPGSGGTSAAGTPTPRATPTLCGDPDASGTITVTDGVLVLRVAADLDSCEDAICDVDDNGTIGVTDGVLVLRAAAGLDGGLHCPAASAESLTDDTAVP